MGWLLAAFWLTSCGDDVIIMAEDPAPALEPDAGDAGDAARNPPVMADAGADRRDAGPTPTRDAGGLDATVADAGTLRLLSRVPEADAEDVRARSPIVLEFSDALDPASVTPSTIWIETEDGPIEGELQLSDDRREVRLVPAAVPLEPARVTAIVSDAVQDEVGRAFAGERWSWTLPLWLRSAAIEAVRGGAVDVALAVDEQDHPLVAWIEGEDGASSVRVARPADDGFELLTDAALAAEAQRGRGHAAWIDPDGTVFVSSIEQESTLVVRRLADTEWEMAFPPWTAQGSIESCDLALAGGVPMLAVALASGSERDVRVLRYDAGQASWVALGTALDRVPAQPASRAVIAAAAPDDVGVAWLEHDGISENLYAARYMPDEDTWSPLGAAVDLELDARVSEPRLAAGLDGELTLLWNEGPAGRAAAYVARWIGRWQVLGGALDAERASTAGALALDARGEPLALLQTSTGSTAQLSLRRYNGSPAPPFGLDARPAVSCAIPDDDDPDFPTTLSATGCFDDVPSRTPASGVLPYSINSPLWSDGALKRRFVVIPEGETIGYREQDAWALPPGTVLIKEFLLQRSQGDPSDVLPMETRFLVKRCEPGACRAAWEGYSYEWNDEGTEAVLLDNVTDTHVKDWTIGARVHRHSYPGRDECTRCHATAAGGALGLQTGQWNRNHDYGQYVDNQIRALAQVGLFGTSLPELTEGMIERSFRLPSPYDPAESIAARVRSYTHVNCSHCHRPDGRWPVVDLRWGAELRGMTDPSPNICDKLVPGDASASLLYLKVSARVPDLPPGFQGDPMPPLATLIADTRQLPAIEAWIDDMQSCP